MSDAPIRVLLVDDEEGFTEVLAKRLRRRGFSAAVALTAAEAQAAAGTVAADTKAAAADASVAAKDAAADAKAAATGVAKDAKAAVHDATAPDKH